MRNYRRICGLIRKCMSLIDLYVLVHRKLLLSAMVPFLDMKFDVVGMLRFTTEVTGFHLQQSKNLLVKKHKF